LGILFLSRDIRGAIYSIYGFVRLADEIVDSFTGYDRETLLRRLKNETVAAIRERISVNPILNAFQAVVHRYGIEWQLIESFFDSMEMDLAPVEYTQEMYERYILGSAECVGLMCLSVFTGGDNSRYETLKPYAMKLGSAFQKVNFLRDMRDDRVLLGRTYFPGVDFDTFNRQAKRDIEADILADLREALEGIRMLPSSSRSGVYLAYRYYRVLLGKIMRLSPQCIQSRRVRVSNGRKVGLMLHCLVGHKFNSLW
jgi:phytoene/squalene synthetase